MPTSSVLLVIKILAQMFILFNLQKQGLLSAFCRRSCLEVAQDLIQLISASDAQIYCIIVFKCI